MRATWVQDFPRSPSQGFKDAESQPCLVVSLTHDHHQADVIRGLFGTVLLTVLSLVGCHRQSTSSPPAATSVLDAPHQAGSVGHAVPCADLAKVRLPSATITTADSVAAGAFVPPPGALGPLVPPGARLPYADCRHSVASPPPSNRSPTPRSSSRSGCRSAAMAGLSESATAEWPGSSST